MHGCKDGLHHKQGCLTLQNQTDNSRVRTKFRAKRDIFLEDFELGFLGWGKLCTLYMLCDLDNWVKVTHLQTCPIP